MKKYELKARRGIDDLLGEYAFIGNSQGDHTRTNDIEQYKAAQGWLSFIFDCDWQDAEAILKESARRKLKNREYIKSLIDQNRFGEEYTINLLLMPNPELDTPSIAITKSPLESYKVIFLDLTT